MKFDWDVLIPAYQAADFIEASIDSALSQTHRPENVVVCDDSSTDDTSSVANRVGSVKVLRNSENSGVGVTRQNLLARASSTWILFLDADDILLPHASEVFALAVARHPNAAVLAFQESGGRERESEEHVVDIRDWSSVSHVDLLARNPICSSATLVRRESLESAGGYSAARRLIDYDSWLRIARTTPRPILLNDSVVVSRLISASTITGNVNAAVSEESRLINREWPHSHGASGIAGRLQLQGRLVVMWLRGLSRHGDYGKDASAYISPRQLEGLSKALTFIGILRTKPGHRAYCLIRRLLAALASRVSTMNAARTGRKS